MVSIPLHLPHDAAAPAVTEQTDSTKSPVRDYKLLHQNKWAYHIKIQDDKHHLDDPALNYITVPSYSHYYLEEEHGKQHHIVHHAGEFS